MNLTSRSRTRRIRRGFTLVEVIVMVTIVAILGGVVATTMLAQGAEGRARAAEIGAARIRQAIALYLVDAHKSRPGQDFEMDLLLLTPEDGGGKTGPYLNSADHLKDPWGNFYVLEYPPGTKNFDFDVVSYGEDGQVGGKGPAEDIRK